jgi:apolipoprotein N-acyltransferase
MTFFLEDERLYRTAIARLLARRGQLLAGGPRAEGGRNAALLQLRFPPLAGGRHPRRYDKQRLLPFAEYFPFASIDLLRREFARVREFVPGPDTPPLPDGRRPDRRRHLQRGDVPADGGARVRAGAAYS